MHDNQKASTLSRRTVIAALAVGAAVNVPAIAAVADRGQPDAALLELGLRYDRLRVATEAALIHLEERQAAYADQTPQPRDVMRHRIEDHVCSGLNMPILPDTGAVTADPKHSAFYSMGEIKLLEHSPPPWNVDLIPAQKARAQGIAEEWRRWKAECSDLRDAIGLSAAEEAWDALDDDLQAIIEQIGAEPATTIAGLSVRARLLQQIYNDLDLDDVGYNNNHHVLVRALIRDVAALVGRTA